MTFSSLISLNPSAAESRQIQVLRGFACVLVVIMHVIGIRAIGGMHVPDDSGWRQLSFLLMHFQMPLFSFLSGFAYAYKPPLEGRRLGFLQNKAVRLLVPFVVVATLRFVSEVAVPNPQAPADISQMWRIYFYPYYHLWFLQAIVIIFAVVVALEAIGTLKTGTRTLLTLAISAVLPFVIRFEGDFFSINGALSLLPFFLLGVGANRFRALLQSPALPPLIGVLFVVTMGYHWLGVLEIAGERVQRGAVAAMAIGASSVVLLFRYFPYNRTLEYLGNASFSIYAYHVFFVAASRLVLLAAGVSNHFIVFVLGVISGVLGPLIIERLVEPIAIGRHVLLGRP